MADSPPYDSLKGNTMDINIDMLYDSESDVDCACRLCGNERGRDHKPRCPGAVIDGLVYEVKYGTHESDGSVTGATLDECVEKAAAELLTCGGHSCEARYVFALHVPELDKRVQEMRVKLVDEWRAKEAERREQKRAADRAAKLTALEAEREDLTPAAYERRRRAIDESA